MPKRSDARRQDPDPVARPSGAEEELASAAFNKPAEAAPVYARPENEVIVVDSPRAMKKLADMIRREKIIGLDTETAFFDKDDDRNKGKLALIQISLPTQGVSVLVDPMKSCDAESETIVYRNLKRLKAALEDPAVTKVAHSAGFDKKVLAECGIEVAELVDTQAMLRQARPDISQISLRIASKYVLGLEIDKGQQTSEWHVRPLSDEQLAYAALDPELAYKLHRALKTILDRSASFAELGVEESLELLDTKMRALDELIDREMPELRALEAKEAALEETLRKRRPGGSEPYSGPDGRVYPGELQKELDIDKLREYFGALELSAKQRATLDAELEAITTYETSRSRLMGALKEHGAAALGFKTNKALEGYLSTFQIPKGTPGVNLTTTYTLKAADPATIDAGADDAILMADLCATSKRILLAFRDDCPEIPALRYEIKALRDQIEEKAEAGTAVYSSEHGSVAFKKAQSAIDIDKLREELPKRFAASLGTAETSELIERNLTVKIARQAISEMLEKPELAFLELSDSKSREPMWDQVLVQSSRHSATRVVPSL